MSCWSVNTRPLTPAWPSQDSKGQAERCSWKINTKLPTLQWCPKRPAGDRREAAHPWMSRVITAHTGENQTRTPRDKAETLAGEYT